MSAATRKKGAPSQREVKLVAAIRDAADDLMRANDYAEGYMARAALVRAMQALNEWAMAGRRLMPPKHWLCSSCGTRNERISHE